MAFNFADILKKLLLQTGKKVVSAVNAPFKRIGQEAQKINLSIPKNKPVLERAITAYPQIVRSIGSNLYKGVPVANTVMPYVANRMAAPIAEIPRSVMDLRTIPEMLKKKSYATAAMTAASPAINIAYSAANIANPIITQRAAQLFTGLDTLKGMLQAQRKKQDILKAGMKGYTGEEVVGLGTSLTDNPELAEKINMAEGLAGLAIPAYHGIKGMLSKGKPTGKLQTAESVMKIPGMEKMTPEQYKTAVKAKIEAEIPRIESPEFVKEARGTEVKGEPPQKTMMRDAIKMVKEYKKNPDVFIEKYSPYPKPPVEGGVRGMLKGKSPEQQAKTIADIIGKNTKGINENFTPLDTMTLLNKLGQKKGVITNKQVLEASKSVGEQRITEKTEPQRLKELARIQSIRNQAESDFQNFNIAQKSNDVKNLESSWNKVVSTFKAIKSEDTLSGQRLQAVKIMGDATKSPMNKTLGLLKTAGVDIESPEIRSAGMTLDWNNPTQVSDFFRTFAPAHAEDWLTKLRYSSMLSSPSTWEKNLESNLQGTGLVAPVEKTILGGIDWLSSKVTGKSRQYFTSEGPAYAKGYYSANAFKSGLKRFTTILKTGTDPLATSKFEQGNQPLAISGTMTGKVENVMDIPMRILRGTDALFQELTSSGVQSSLKYRQKRGAMTVEDIIGKSQLEARTRLFNVPVGQKQGGYVTDMFGGLGELIQIARRSNNPPLRTFANFVAPFIQIPTNIAKTSIQYSPFGVADMLGAANKKEVLSRALLGTGIAVATGLMASSDRITADEPKSPTEKDDWKAAGMQKWSVKLGDTWVSYQYMHPAFSYNMALAAYFKSKWQQIPKSWGDKVLGLVGMTLNNFFANSYVKNVGDLFDAMQGDPRGMSNMAANFPQQVIPFRAFQGWLNKAFDPKVRNTDPEGTGLARSLDGILKQIKMNIVGGSFTMPARTDLMGQEMTTSPMTRAINALISTTVSPENPENKAIYENMFNRLQEKRLKDQQLEQLKQGTSTGVIPPTQAATINQTDTMLARLTAEAQTDEKNRVIKEILTRTGKYIDRPTDVATTQKLLQIEKVTPQDMQTARLYMLKTLTPENKATSISEMLSTGQTDFTSLFKAGVLTTSTAQQLERQGLIQDAEALMKKMKSTDVYYQRATTRKLRTSTLKKMVALQKRTIKSMLSKKAKTYKLPKFKPMKIKKVKIKKAGYKLPKLRLK